MDLNVSKSKTLLIRGDLAERNEDGMETVATQKDLGVVMSQNLFWSANCQRRTTRACVISLTVEIQFVSLMHLELGEWIRGANPTFTELVELPHLDLAAIVLRV